MTRDRYSQGCAYKFQPADARVIREISTEVMVVHHRVKESKWMVRGRIHAQERDDVGV